MFTVKEAEEPVILMLGEKSVRRWKGDREMGGSGYGVLPTSFKRVTS